MTPLKAAAAEVEASGLCSNHDNNVRIPSRTIEPPLAPLLAFGPPPKLLVAEIM